MEKLSIFKVRDQIHMGEDKGVPATYRARIGRPIGSRGNKDSVWDPKLRESLILEYIKNYPGQPTTLEEFAKVARFRNSSSAQRTLLRLEKAGKISKLMISRRSSAYNLLGSPALPKPALPKGDERNGEVIIHKPSKTLQQHIDEGTVESLKPEVPVQAIVDAEISKTPSKSGEEIYCDNLDLFIWEYLKDLDVSSAAYQNTALGDSTQALRSFSKWLRAKQDTSNEEKNES